jgi:beta-hydroxyacyl-ACP dehydratase FabZ
VVALVAAGVVELPAERQFLTITEPVEVREPGGGAGATLIAAPPAGDEFQILYDLDYGEIEPIKQQLFAYRLAQGSGPRVQGSAGEAGGNGMAMATAHGGTIATEAGGTAPTAVANGGGGSNGVALAKQIGGDFAREIAPARTFVTVAEAEMLRSRGLGTHLQAGDVLVLDQGGPVGTEYRFPNECVRHKVLDLIGDLYLLGCPIKGKIVAYKSGHSLNHALVRKLTQMLHAQRRARLAVGEPVMDVKRILRLMPHRYPMLLVDRVIEMDGDRRALGVKNVTMNEPFFEGHYPGMPVMPGVLIVEAMAQLSGLLLSRKLEHSGKIPLLLSLDKVKLRRPVVPGDQLILESENIRVKARMGHVKCRAYVGDQVAAEAEIKFMLVDNELGG